MFQIVLVLQLKIKIEVPYLDNKTFLDDYFGLGVTWHDQDAAFYPEVQKIDTYIKEKIDDGEIANDQTAVKTFIKSLEKVNNLKGETRAVVKLEVLANYIDFLTKNDSLKSKLKRYAN
jgi:hypothetical protein